MFKNLFFFIVFIVASSAKNPSHAQLVNDAVLQSYKRTNSIPTAQKTRPFLKSSEKNGAGKVFLGSLLFIYQNVFSEQISAQCTYQISCSEYTKRCIEKHGIWIGSIQGFHQFMHCTPNAHEEAPEYMKSNLSSKIQNHVD